MYFEHRRGFVRLKNGDRSLTFADSVSAQHALNQASVSLDS